MGDSGQAYDLSVRLFELGAMTRNTHSADGNAQQRGRDSQNARAIRTNDGVALQMGRIAARRVVVCNAVWVCGFTRSYA